MSAASEIKAEIRMLKREMRDAGIPVRSCFNGGHSSESLRANQRLFALKAALAKAESTKAREKREELRNEITNTGDC